MKRLLIASYAILLMGTVAAMAQNPPGAAQKERVIREDAGRPTVVAPPRREREEIVVPAPDERGTVGQGRRGPVVDDPPGSEFQDRGINEELGKPAEGDGKR
jgi:hypothetical protein